MTSLKTGSATQLTTFTLCRIDDIPAAGAKGFDINGQAIFAVNKDGAIYIYHNRFQHLGNALEWNTDQFLNTDSTLIQCSTHGALFVIESGQCVAGPCLAKTLTVVDHDVVDDMVIVKLPASGYALRNTL